MHLGGMIMNVSIEKEQANKIQFTISDAMPAFVNSIRRYSMTHVPIVAMDNVVFYDNTSSLFDEYLGHRLGLIPITTPDKTPADAEFVFSLDEAGPKVVYAKDMKSSDKDIKAARENIPIISLTEGQRIKFEATARVGYGTTHAKFQAGIVSYSLDKDKYRFIVESFYQMEPKDVLFRGCAALEKDITEIAKCLKSAAKKK